MSASTFYVFISGPMSEYPSGYLACCSEMSAYARKFMEMGMCPINPAGDMLEGLVSPVPLDGQRFKRRSMELLRLLEGKPAAVFVISTVHRDGRVADGVVDEIAEAERLAIPVVFPSLHQVEEIIAMREAI